MAEKYSTDEIIEALQKSKGRVYVAAKDILHCDPKTIYNRAKKVKSVADAIKIERGQELDIVELKLREQIMNGNVTAMIFYLKTQGYKRGWSEKIDFNINIELISQTVKALEAIGENPTDVFNAIIAKAAQKQLVDE
jgi:hypothetical protein